MGFISGMQSYFNTQKPVTGIHCINGLKNDAIILIDEEKAFDKYPTCNPKKTLSKLGIEGISSTQ